MLVQRQRGPRAHLAPALIVLLIAGAPVAAQEAGSKRPVPSEPSQAEATKLAKEIYGAQYAQADTADQKQALARLVLNDAAGSKADPAAHFVLLRLAADIAARAGDVALALQAVEQIDGAYEVEAFPLKAPLAPLAANAAADADQHLAAAEFALGLIDEAVELDDFAAAVALGEIARVSARKANDTGLASRALARTKEVEAIRAEFDRIRDAVAKLKASPSDPEANLAVGKYYGFIKGDWRRAIPMIAVGSDPRLNELARKELQGVSAADEQLALGDGWWEMSSALDAPAAGRVQRHAAKWYEQALPRLSGLTKARVEKRLEEARPAAGELILSSGAVLVFTFEPRTFTRRGGAVIVEDLSGKGNHGLVSGAQPAPGKVGAALAFNGKNTHVECAPSETLQLAEAFTLCAWVNPRSWRGDAIDYIISKDDWKDGPSRGFVLRGRDRGVPNLTVGSSGWRSTAGPERLEAGQWRHLTATCGEGRISLFVDGVLQHSSPAPTPISLSTYNLRIGRGHFAADRGFDGAIDEVAIFSRVLTKEEIKTVYLHGVQGKTLAK